MAKPAASEACGDEAESLYQDFSEKKRVAANGTFRQINVWQLGSVLRNSH